jgi:putative ABC transport system ATP-binding protein
MVLLEDVSRRYQVGDNEVYALRDVHLEIDQGEFAVVLGPSGSGKTTLLNMISALDSPTSGRATVAGQEITGMDRADLFRFRREVVIERAVTGSKLPLARPA